MKSRVADVIFHSDGTLEVRGASTKLYHDDARQLSVLLADYAGVETPMHKFVQDRLFAMEQCPEMWAGTKEAFGLQLILLVDVLHHTNSNTTKVHELMGLVFGPGNSTPMEFLNDVWARERVEIVRKYLVDNVRTQA